MYDRKKQSVVATGCRKKSKFMESEYCHQMFSGVIAGMDSHLRNISQSEIQDTHSELKEVINVERKCQWLSKFIRKGKIAACRSCARL